MGDDLHEKTAGFIQLSSSALRRDIDGQSVLLDLQSEAYFALDDVGSDVLRVAQESPDFSHAIDVLLAIYDVDEATLRSDVHALLKSLKDEGLIIGEW